MYSSPKFLFKAAKGSGSFKRQTGGPVRRGLPSRLCKDMCKSVQDSDIRVKHSIAKSLVSNHSSDHSPPRASLVRGGQPASAAMRYPTRNPARCLLTLQKGERGGTSAAFINDRHTARHNNPSCRHSPSLSSPGSRRAGRSSVKAASSISPHTRPLISHPTLPSPPPLSSPSKFQPAPAARRSHVGSMTLTASTRPRFQPARGLTLVSIAEREKVSW